jgi:hypothetical protein
MIPLGMVCGSLTLISVFSMRENHWKWVLGQNQISMFFVPRKWRGSHDPPGSGVRLIHTHIRVPRAQKPLETSSQAKLVFDVLLTCHTHTHTNYFISSDPPYSRGNNHSTDYLSNSLFSFKMQKETESHAEYAIMERPWPDTATKCSRELIMFEVPSIPRNCTD